jgi:large subunit ribosomal protein L46
MFPYFFTSLVGPMFYRQYSSIKHIPKIKVGILLKRKPILTKELSEFEHNYLLYRDLQRNQDAKPFHHEFYFKKGTLSEKRWLTAQNENPGQVVQPAELEFIEWQEVNIEKNDVKSLDRKLRENIYLFVKTKDGYELPTGVIHETEVLHEAAPNRLKELIGSKLQTWFVGRVPCGMLQQEQNTVYYMKAHILAGKISKITDYQWLTKDELKDVNPTYFEGVKDML